MDYLAAGSPKMYFRKITRLDSNEICLDADMIRLLIAIDDKKDLKQIAQEVGMQRTTLNATLSKLLELNLIEPVQKDIPYLNEEFLSALKMNLSRIVGPMAEILIDDAVRDLNLSLHEIPKNQAAELITVISVEIPDEQGRIFFKKAMLGELKKLEE